MKRQELKALLHGVENAGEIIDQIMEINGADIENAKKEKRHACRTAQSVRKGRREVHRRGRIRAFEDI